jgi:hypothetical protein
MGPVLHVGLRPGEVRFRRPPNMGLTRTWVRNQVTYSILRDRLAGRFVLNFAAEPAPDYFPTISRKLELLRSCQLTEPRI